MSHWEIPNIKPFSDVFYKTCMYNPLLTGVYYFNGSIMPFLANDFFTYQYNEKKGFRLLGKNIKPIPELRLINNMGIASDFNFNADNYVEEIKEALNSNFPVFVPIDRFYWSDEGTNTAFYNVRHFAHYFLAFGYNDIDQKFDIVDVIENNCNCFKSKIEYNELVECYQGFCKNLESDVKAFKMYRNTSVRSNKDLSCPEEYIAIHRMNFINYKEEIYNGLENIKKAIELYKNCIDDSGELLKEDQVSISMPFSFIERSKKAQMYQVYTFFGEKQEIFQCLKNIIDNFAVVKGLLLKMVIAQSCNEKSMNTVVERLEEIYRQEKNYYTMLTNML